jgi:hypothetical protein
MQKPRVESNAGTWTKIRAKSGVERIMFEDSNDTTTVNKKNRFFNTNAIIQAMQREDRAMGLDIPYEFFNNGNFKAVVEIVGV